MTIKPSVQIPQGLTLQQATPKRVMRRPSHPFNVHHRPFQIQPFMIAPVLPGETLKNLVMQSRAVTDPIKNPLIGWWLEHYYFYVPLRALENNGTDQVTGSNVIRTDIEAMLLDMTQPLTDTTVDFDPYYMKADGGHDWLTGCMNSIVSNYFRDAHDPGTYELDFLPQAAINNKNWTDSLWNEVDLAADDQTVTGIGNVSDDNVDISIQQLDTAYQTWLVLREQRLTEKTYEDYIAEFGVRLKPQDQLKPELIRFSREWTYPTNTVNPADVLDSEDNVVLPAGTPSSACSWSVSLRADKDRFFKEPGFIIGVTVARPKIYLQQQSTYAAAMLKDCLSWLPAVMKDRVETSLKLIQENKGPLKAVFTTSDQGYWLDIRDLFLYGDQFINYDPSGIGSTLPQWSPNIAGLPTDDHYSSRFMPDSDIDELFVDAGTDSATGKVRQDGVTNLSILGTQMDYT